jgi:hydrogenase expression/formation protein HypD
MQSKTNEAFSREVAACRDLVARLARRVTIMEVCGTHTVAICRSGLRDLLPKDIRLISGPGCPVCVSTQSYIDACIELAGRPGVTLATYGDMLRVPGTHKSLAEVRSEGARIVVVYSAQDALTYAEAHPDEKTAFVAVGFETTAPATALALKAAAAKGLRNFSALLSHKRIIPAMSALLTAPDLSIDAFLCPGHVSVIIGPEQYAPVAATGRPCVIAGFEGVDVARAVRMILTQIIEGRPAVQNEYSRAVKPGGNPHARELFAEVFDIADEEWRGLGCIPQSGFVPKAALKRFDARAAHGLEMRPAPEPPGCRCGEVVRGAIDPEDCPLFGKACTTGHPIGPCMVSREGSCSAHYKYRSEPVS